MEARFLKKKHILNKMKNIIENKHFIYESFKGNEERTRK